jgi:hypothetical protein
MRGNPQPKLKEEFLEISKKAPDSCGLCETIQDLAKWIGCNMRTGRRDKQL